MKRFSFSSYSMDDPNRAAFDFCKRVAALDFADPMPVVLLGDQGTGKTHLLSAIAYEVLSSSTHALLVAVAPDDCADAVRKLVEDPTPVDMAQHAILLVDDLDRFTGNLDTLEAITQIFLENDHAVVCTSCAHPSSIQGVPETLRHVLERSRVIELGPVDRQESSPPVASSRTDAGAVELVRAYDEEDAVDVLRETVEMLTKELSGARRRLGEAQGEIEHLQGENSLLKVARMETNPLQERIQTPAQNEEKAGASRHQTHDSDDSDLRKQLNEARADAGKAREEAQNMLNRAERLMTHMQQSREEFYQARTERQHQLEEIQNFEAVFTGARSETAPDATENESADEPEKAWRIEHDSLVEEQRQLQESLVRAHSERDTLKSILDSLRKELDDTRRDHDQRRQEDQLHKEAENSHLETLEIALAETRAEMDEEREAHRVIAEELLSLQSQLSEGAGVLERLMELFGIPDDIDDRLAEGLARPDTVQYQAAEHETIVPQARSQEASDPEESETARTIYRADFGESRNRPADAPPTLHHVEELHDTFDLGAEEIDEPDEQGPLLDQHKSA